MGYNSAFIPDGTDKAITTTTTSAELVTDGAFVVNLTGSGGVDLASLPTPQKLTNKATVVPADTTPYTELETYVYPNVIIGQLLILNCDTIASGSIAVSATDEAGAAKTYTFDAVGESIFLEAQALGYKVLFNNSVTVSS